MKKIILSSLLLFAIVISSNAQIELNAYAGYVPGAKFSYIYSSGGRLRIDGGGNFGFAIGKVLPNTITVELSYNHFESVLKQDGGLSVFEPRDITVDYYQLGMLKPLMEGETFIPYGLFSLGASRFAPEGASEEYWRFAINAGLGMKYFFTDKLGIRIQARILMPLYFAGAGFGCGISTSGSSCGTGIGMGSEILQADFTGGVILRVGQ